MIHVILNFKACIVSKERFPKKMLKLHFLTKFKEFDKKLYFFKQHIYEINFDQSFLREMETNASIFGIQLRIFQTVSNF